MFESVKQLHQGVLIKNHERKTRKKKKLLQVVHNVTTTM